MDDAIQIDCAIQIQIQNIRSSVVPGIILMRKQIKYRNMAEILQKRKQSTDFNFQQSNHALNSKPKHSKDDVSSFHPLKEIQPIDPVSLTENIHSLLSNQSILTLEQKYQIFNFIEQKTGISLNKDVFVNQISVKAYTKVQQLERTLAISKFQKNYFIFQGKVLLYGFKVNQNQNSANKAKRRTIKSIYELEEEQHNSLNCTYNTVEEFQSQNLDYEKLEEFHEHRTLGSLFTEEKEDKKIEKQKQSLKESNYLKDGNNHMKYKLLVQNAILVTINNATSVELENIKYNDGISHKEKQSLLDNFTVLQKLGRRLATYTQNFIFKRYALKDCIYKVGDQAKYVYFIVKGQVNFQITFKGQQDHNEIHKLHQTELLIEKNKKISTANCISTETLGSQSYFGEEEILFRQKRCQTARVISSDCQMLILEKQKFEKLLNFHQFHEVIRKAATIKKEQRIQKLQKAKKILQNFSQKYEEEKTNKVQKLQNNEQQLKMFLNKKEVESVGKASRKFSLRKSQNDSGVKIMHGNIMKQFTTIPKEMEAVNFSMLKVNPDMYEATLKKFRKFNMNQPAKYAPYLKWNFERVWKVLHLEDILREEDSEITSPEGRRIYDCHRRYRNQVSETKSFRPKTTSSTYRTKLQYIAYLQQFNN